jgi:hypothetical protein
MWKVVRFIRLMHTRLFAAMQGSENGRVVTIEHTGRLVLAYGPTCPRLRADLSRSELSGILDDNTYRDGNKKNQPRIWATVSLSLKRKEEGFESFRDMIVTGSCKQYVPMQQFICIINYSTRGIQSWLMSKVFSNMTLTLLPEVCNSWAHSEFHQNSQCGHHYQIKLSTCLIFSTRYTQKDR